jgi:molybdopterin synthase catalytic subunit
MNYEQQIEVLKETIQWFKKQIEPHDCGWMYTTIDGLKHRIKILKNEMKKDLPKETWVKGYNRHKKNYNKWKEDQCPHN